MLNFVVYIFYVASLTFVLEGNMISKCISNVFHCFIKFLYISLFSKKKKKEKKREKKKLKISHLIIKHA